MKTLFKITKWAFGIFIALFMLGIMIETCSPTEPLTEAEKAQYQKEQDSIKAIEDSIAVIQAIADSIENRTKEIEKQFSGWNGAHTNLQYLIKENLKDPKSYEHISTHYYDKETYLLVTTKYRAKNSFGGYVIETIQAQTTLTGEIIQIIE